MLFPYTYVPHQMEKMQGFIDFIFYEVWCKAPIGLVFHPDLFDGNPDLKDVMSEFGFSTKAAERGKAFYKDIKAIYELFALLSASEIDQFKHWYQSNNDLEKVCANDPDAQIVRYCDIPVAHKTLGEHLAAFYKDLYSHALLDIAVLRARIGDIDSHYKYFTRVNKVGKCPFCGMVDLLGPTHLPRDSYDHYLPKSMYPFNSINFHNLVPACHHCNSSYKTSKDPAHTSKSQAGPVERRKVFYPFADTPRDIDLQINLHHSDIEKLTHSDITLKFGPDDIHEEIETWKDVYGIEERYKAKFCGDSDGKYWLMQVMDEWREDGRQPADYLATLTRQAKSRPYANCNFLRKPFLEACNNRGFFASLV